MLNATGNNHRTIPVRVNTTGTKIGDTFETSKPVQSVAPTLTPGAQPTGRVTPVGAFTTAGQKDQRRHS